MPNKLRIITHLVTKPTKKPFSLLNHVKEVKENIHLSIAYIFLYFFNMI